VVLSAAPVFPAASPDALQSEGRRPVWPVALDPITDRGGDRLTAATSAGATSLPSAALIAARSGPAGG
jgi:hypothetical protein